MPEFQRDEHESEDGAPAMDERGLLPVKVDKGMQFAVHDGIRLTGDFYRPDGGGDHPVLVAVHGGGWRRGAADMYQYWGRWLASRGIALFTIDYRLVDGERNRYPAAVHDVRAAVQFVRANAQRLGVKESRIGLVGDSAGAHLAALVALAGDAPPFALAYHDDPHASVSTAVKAVIGAYGVYDMLAQWQHDQIDRPRDQIAELLLGVSPLDNKFRYFEASPYAYVTTKAVKTSFLICWGTGDDVVDCTTQSENFVTALKQVGCFVRTVAVPGAPHFWMSDPIDEPGGFAGFVAPKLLRFLSEQL
jgi:acetyl esterase/lipase